MIDSALQEDVGTGDITSDVLFPERREISAEFLAKQEGVLAGLPLISRIFQRLDPQSRIETYLADGDALRPGIIFAKVTGDARAILSGERLALNFVQRLSGIATQTARFARQARAYGIAVLDTRKTTPLLRSLEKYAVKTGGGENHRFGLQDGILVKDNHLKLQPDFKKILTQFREKGHSPEKVEIEVTDVHLLKAAMQEGGVWFLLDNMPPEMIRECISLKTRKMKFEVSGGITADNFQDFLIPGVDAISIGALTHSIKSLDISLEIEV